MSKTLKVKVLDKAATHMLPKQAKPGDAGFDIFLLNGKQLAPGEVAVFKTGIAVAIPEGYVGLMRSRSSAFKKGLNVSGTVDCGYRGELLVCIQNVSKDAIFVESGACYAQLVLVEFLSTGIEVVDVLDDTERGTGGFGSTGNTGNA